MRTFSPFSRGALGLLLVACGASPDADPGGAPGTADASAASACAEGFLAQSPGGCAPVLPSAPCAPGTRAQLGSAACVPVGVTTCPAGFVAHASGWGCDVALPDAMCDGATRARLGETTCAPIDDCAAAFPPAEATLFVSAGYGPAEIDATHFKTIGAALAAASAGAVIAVDEGTYLEAPSIVTPVTLVGRCASKVIVSSADGTGKGLQARVGGVAARHLTLRGFEVGVLAIGGLDLSSAIVEMNRYAGVFADKRGKAKLSNVVVRDTHMLLTDREAYGVLAENGAQVDVDDSVVEGNEFANLGALDPTTRLRVTRSIVRNGRKASGARAQPGGVGAVVSLNGALEVRESAVVENRDNGIDLLAKGGAVTVERSVVRGTLRTDSADGVGILASSGTVTAKETTFISNGRAELSMLGDARATLESIVTLRDEREPKDAIDGVALIAAERSETTARALASISAGNMGVLLQKGARLSLEDSLIFGTRPRGDAGGYAVASLADTSLVMRRTTIEGAGASAILVDGGAATIEASLVRGTRSRAGHAGNGANVQHGGRMEVSRTAFVANRSIGVGVIDEGASLALQDVSVLDTDADESGAFGIGVFVAGAKATIASSTIGSSKSIGLALAAATGSVTSSTLVRNAVAVHAQDGTALEERAAADETPMTVTIAPSTQFLENATRVGSGEVPLPATF